MGGALAVIKTPPIGIEPMTCRLTQVFTGFHRFSQVFTGFHRFSQVFTGFHRFSQVFTGFHIFKYILKKNGTISLKNSV